MPRLNISRDTCQRLNAFLGLAEQILGEPLTIEQCAEGLIHMGMRAILDGLWRQQDPNALIETLQKLAAAHPQQVYPFLAEVLKVGGEILQEQERQGGRLGFHPQPADS